MSVNEKQIGAHTHIQIDDKMATSSKPTYLDWSFFINILIVIEVYG